MLWFQFTGPNGTRQCNDGEIVRQQPHVRLVLGMLADLKLPPIESLGAPGAPTFVAQFNATHPADPPVGEVVDGTLDGAGGPLVYRLYRPATRGPYPIVVYFSTAAVGCWGDAQSDDPFCRDLCRRSGTIVLSSDPRTAHLRGRLLGLPPAFVVAAEFDPLRDEGIAYAEALAEADVAVEQLQARGHLQSSFTMVDVIATAVSGREMMAQALRRFAGLEEPGVLPKAGISSRRRKGSHWQNTPVGQMIALWPLGWKPSDVAGWMKD